MLRGASMGSMKACLVYSREPLYYNVSIVN